MSANISGALRTRVLTEIRTLGCRGGCSIVKNYLRSHRANNPRQIWPPSRPLSAPSISYRWFCAAPGVCGSALGSIKTI